MLRKLLISDNKIVLGFTNETDCVIILSTKLIHCDSSELFEYSEQLLNKTNPKGGYYVRAGIKQKDRL